MIYPVPTVADGNGVAVAQFPARPPGKRVRVAQITVSAQSALVSSALVVLNSLLVCGTGNGNNDTADGEPPIPLGPSDNLSVQWQNCTPGANCIAVFFYEDVATKAAA